MDHPFKIVAERFFRGIYGGDPTVVDQLAGESLILSYPLFTRIFETPVLEGKDAVKKFAVRFATRWTQPNITVHAALEDDHQVVLLWSFQARHAEDLSLHQWGGFSFFQFDQHGKIVAEIGEESTPGPFARWHDKPSPASK